jgi:DNA-3-methyladenine glycosylase
MFSGPSGASRVSLSRARKAVVCMKPMNRSLPDSSPLPSSRLPPVFFRQVETESLARKLLGVRLVTVVRGVRTSGEIVEVEAYLGRNDPACHASRGKTGRNAMMFEAAGHCYVYLIYGIYHCVNVVSDPEGVGSGVLIRAVTPMEGIETMRRRRGRADMSDVARGPGRLCQSFGITASFCGEHFATSQRIWLEPFTTYSREQIAISGRIGISAGQELPLRFFVKHSPWVSGTRR